MDLDKELLELEKSGLLPQIAPGCVSSSDNELELGVSVVEGKDPVLRQVSVVSGKSVPLSPDGGGGIHGMGRPLLQHQGTPPSLTNGHSPPSTPTGVPTTLSGGHLLAEHHSLMGSQDGTSTSEPSTAKNSLSSMVPQIPLATAQSMAAANAQSMQQAAAGMEPDTLMKWFQNTELEKGTAQGLRREKSRRLRVTVWSADTWEIRIFGWKRRSTCFRASWLSFAEQWDAGSRRCWRASHRQRFRSREACLTISELSGKARSFASASSGDGASSAARVVCGVPVANGQDDEEFSPPYSPASNDIVEAGSPPRVVQGVPRSSRGTVAASRAYVTQKPFLMNAAIRENILFHTLLQEDKYFDVLQKCCLLPDLEMFSDYDFTLVGESGVQLSGGQKARVGLARALYSDADLLFLDDVLSAVDAHTGRFIFDKVICHEAGAGRAVFLVTHQLQYVKRPEISQIFLLEDGDVKKTTWEAIQQNGIPDFLAESSAEDEPDDETVAGADSGFLAVPEMNELGAKQLSGIGGRGLSGVRTLSRDSAGSKNKTAGRGRTASSGEAGSDDGDTAEDQSAKKPKKKDKKKVQPDGSTSDYLKNVEARELVANAQTHPVYLGECTESVVQILRGMEGHRITSRLVSQVTSLLLGSEDETRYSGDITSADFLLYLRAFGTMATNAFLLAILILLAVFSVLGPVWLTHWANQTKTPGGTPAGPTSDLFVEQYHVSAQEGKGWSTAFGFLSPAAAMASLSSGAMGSSPGSVLPSKSRLDAVGICLAGGCSHQRRAAAIRRVAGAPTCRGRRTH